ncbi:MAG TPA: lysophospholipid acyltransferase family protein [Gemmatimonadota bacterium]|nr:lysophospholipid acyltransferase family protein [Gemmatimonadota bacterium]
MWRTAYAWFMGGVYTGFWATIGILTWPLSPGGDLYLRYARIWSGWILGSLGIPLEVIGQERLEPGRTYVLMSNHQSVFDIFALFRAFDRPFRMVAKRVLFWIPILGWSMWMCGFIPIDRSKRESAIRSLDRAARKIRSGTSVLMFPEGTRSLDGTLHPFKKGGFMLALKAGVPVVPVVVLGTDSIMEKGSLRVGRAEIEVRIGRPIEIAGRGAGSRDRLMDEVRRAMIDLGATACEDVAA